MADIEGPCPTSEALVHCHTALLQCSVLHLHHSYTFFAFLVLTFDKYHVAETALELTWVGAVLTPSSAAGQQPHSSCSETDHCGPCP